MRKCEDVVEVLSNGESGDQVESKSVKKINNYPKTTARIPKFGGGLEGTCIV